MVRLWQRVFILFAGVLLCAALAHAEEAPNKSLASAKEAPDNEQRRIREIRIHIESVYTEEEVEKSSWANFINRWHTPTRESVIRTDLLFKEGDVLDQELLEASERSLRRFRFLSKAEITVLPVDDQTVDLEVHTKDAQSLVPGVNFKGGGDLYTLSAHLMEVNLLGYGKKLYGEVIHESDVGNTWKFGYSDYQLLNSRWVGNATYTTGPLVESFVVTANLPLYSPDSKWAYGMTAFVSDRTVRLFEDGEESSRFAKDLTMVNGYMKRATGPRNQKTKLSLTLNYLTADYSPLGSQTTTPPPPDQANLTPTIGISKENVRFAKFTYLNKMGRVEDNWIGVRYGGNVGYGIPLEDGFELWDLRAFVFNNTAWANKHLLKLNAQVDSEWVRNTVVFGSARYYRKFSKHTFATRFKVQLGYELDSSRQFTLGANSGLRGYPARQFSGEQLMLLNIEDRQFWGRVSIGPKLDIGTVLFVDAGNVWKDEEEVDLDDLNWSAGFGFRLSLTNMPRQPILRIDFGWALGEEDNFAITVGHEQQF